MNYTEEDLKRVAAALFAYKEGDFVDGPRKGSKWAKADFMTTRRYENLAKQALDAFTNN